MEVTVTKGRSVHIHIRSTTGALSQSQYLRLTVHRGPYWLFNGPELFFVDRCVERFGDWAVYCRSSKVTSDRDAWFAIRDFWIPFCDWCRELCVHLDIYISRTSIDVEWPSPAWYLIGGGLRGWDTTPSIDEIKARAAAVAMECEAHVARAYP